MLGMLNSVFSYFIAENKKDIPELPVSEEFGKYTISMDANTTFSYASNEKASCAIYGLAVNVISGESEKLAEEIVETCASITDVVAYEKQLGGKYILLFKTGEESFYLHKQLPVHTQRKQLL